MDLNNRPIGFFDSGVGGLSVLKEAIKILPNENFIYYGDSKNAPYGTKKVEEVKDLTFKASDFLLEKGVKAIVIACNTATSAAIEDLRAKYSNIPIIGIEPALKPAVELERRGNIIIMATPMTLAENKFNNLMKSYENKASIVPLPCAGLAELIEHGVLEGEELISYLKDKFNNLLEEPMSSIVLGCTHYPFIKKELMKLLPQDVVIIDGSSGTARHLKRQLEERNWLNIQKTEGHIEIINSLEDSAILNLCNRLLLQ